MAEECLALGRTDRARCLFQKILDNDTYPFEALMGLGFIEAGDGELDAAADCFARAVRIRPRAAQAHYNLGLVLKSLDRLDESVRHLETALDNGGDKVAITTMLGNVLAAMGRNPEAEQRYRQAVEHDPGYVMAWFNLGVLLQAWGRSVEAADCYRKAVELNPGFAEAWTNLGTIHQEDGKDLNAVQCFHKALAAKADFSDALVNLGLVMCRLGRHDGASIHALAADRLAYGPDFPHYSLGLLFAKLGQNDKAGIHLDKSLEQDPSDTQGALLILAALGLKSMPARSSEAQIKRLYESRAATWDLGATGQGAYQGHVLLARLFDELVPDASCCAILDAGCGTGLVGDHLIRRQPKSLDGVDLSEAMLARAQKRGIYDRLHMGELVRFMEDRPQGYDVVCSAATLIHFGDLTPVFKAAATTLRPQGRFLFTVFSGDEEPGCDLSLSFSRGHAEGGCYLHSRHHIAKAAEMTDFQVEYLAQEIHEYDRGEPVAALVVGLRRH